MATVTFEQSSFDTSNVTSYASSVNGAPGANFAPAVGDIIVVFVVATATVAAGGMTESTGEVTFTKITTAVKASSADTIYLFVSNGFVKTTGTRTVTFTCTGDAATNVCQVIYTISGMSKYGASAVRQSAVQSNGSALATPQPAFNNAALTGNPILGCVANASSPAGMTKPAGSSPTWTEDADIGSSTPTVGLETISVASGFTGTTVTWGSTSASIFGSIIAEFDASDITAGEKQTCADQFGQTDPRANPVEIVDY